ncbi:MAG: GntR family transcriptional regulator [Caldilineaceae bacterium]|nr:GntR family transcriptional regulator [Caldilineaceae bacterium]MBP8123072.1 GntR family transcriptional regulator [Caldilineaceae bacterium]MBP9073390.1 GntR family transcriptional regulator [Caldilineaceae bacterium]
MESDALAQVLSPPLKRSLADDVAERLREAILSGQLAPGERLRETELSEMMGVSRGPVREALRRLESEGLVFVGRTGRTKVARLSLQDLDEVFSLRKALERVAIEYACEYATSEDLDELQAIVDDMAIALARGINEKEGAEFDLRFHDVVYRASRHQRLGNSWISIRSQTYIIMLSRNVASADFRDSVVHGHQEIVDAITARDKERALAVIEQHMFVAYERVSKSYGQTHIDLDQDE